ncbi:MAG: GIY-YIG nuclease family protein [Leptospiraceae bacterium]|nr:GIY-YIG nuclease family protein [Leptospiraceae bacterium]MCP5513367.1 GIY-YIG nuclease family protein [Leptospiraceae bacterium]
MPFVYILKCSDDSFYVGSTWSLENRVQEHQMGLGSNHTSKHLPVELVYYERFGFIEDAYHREKQIQGWSRKKKIALIEGNDMKLHFLAECRNESHFVGKSNLDVLVWGSASLTPPV